MMLLMFFLLIEIHSMLRKNTVLIYLFYDGEIDDR